jgi:hypothetical protein
LLLVERHHWRLMYAKCKLTMTTENLTSPSCVYCGKPVRKTGRGEHIVPKVIGGALTIADVSDRVVCSTCNNGVLSNLDRELCSRSHLSIVASQEIDAHLWQAWEVDTTSGNVLLDARPVWDGVELRQLICFPQITFERGGPELRGDLQEIQDFGRDNFEKVLFKSVRHAFERYRRGEKRVLHFEHIQSATTSQGYRHPPRIFARRSIKEIADNYKAQRFVLRYCNSDDKRFALRCLSRFDDPPKVNRWREKTGTLLPAIGHFFDMGLTLRALLKIGINLLAAFCQKTPVDKRTFRKAISVICGAAEVQPALIDENGFVEASGITQIQAPGRSHSFRLVHHDGHWLIYSSFFGGRIGSVVSIPGPNKEEWNTLEVVAPLNDKDWSVSRYKVLNPIKVRIEWSDIAKIAPTLKCQNAISRILVEHVAVPK